MKFLIVIVCVLLIGGNFYKKMKKVMLDWEASADSKASPAHNAFGQVCADGVVEGKSPSFAEENRPVSYFSYEDEAVSTVPNMAAESNASTFDTNQRESNEMLASGDVVVTTEGINTNDNLNLDFDLREAVVCQTVLSNPYLQQERC